MPTNNIRRNRHGNKVYNKNATGRRGMFNHHGEYILLPRRITHTSPVIRTPMNDGYDNPTRIRHQRTKECYHE